MKLGDWCIIVNNKITYNSKNKHKSHIFQLVNDGV